MTSHLTWVEVDLSAIQNNVQQMKTIAGTRLMAVVKANAYGRGVEAVARRRGTINDEVLCGISARVPRIYHRSKA